MSWTSLPIPLMQAHERFPDRLRVQMHDRLKPNAKRNKIRLLE